MLFPGQGSQSEGMGSELFGSFPELTSLASEVLGYDLPRLCTENPDGLLDDTRFTQPALYVVNALSYENSLRKGEPEGDFLLGHSLGEYNALLAAGAFDFETGLKLVVKRGELMARAGGGAMLAVVGSDEDALRDLLSPEEFAELDVANLNTPTQNVLSGPDEAIAHAQRLLEERGTRVARLRVSAPFHSRYMEPARDEFEAFLKGFRFAPLRKTVIANVTARPYEDHDVARTLSDQISGPVRWLESVRRMLTHVSPGDWREAGHGGVLTRMMRQIEPWADGTAAGGGRAAGHGTTAQATAHTTAPAETQPARRDVTRTGTAGRAAGRPGRRPRLFCVAYAGGDARAYAGLAEHLPDVDVVTLERPGRGRRVSEPLLSEPGQIVDDLLAQLRGPLETGAPYGLYGHSLGARLAFLLCRRLREESLPAPRHLLVSGECGPSVPSRERDTWRLPRDAFWDHMKQLGGTPAELFEYEDLMNFYERVLRADFTALGSCVYHQEAPLDLPITAVVGEDEWLTDEEVGAWQRESTRPLNTHRFPGGHFFIRENWAALAELALSGSDSQSISGSNP